MNEFQDISNMNIFMKGIVKQAMWSAVVGVITLTFIGMWLNEWNFFKAISFALIGGVIEGIAAGFINYRFAVPKYLLNEIPVDLEAGERLNFQASAHYSNTLEANSGKLFLTTRRLIFKCHRQSKKKVDLNIQIKELESASSFKTLNLFNNGLIVHTKDGSKYEFITKGTVKWVYQLSDIENGLQQSA